MTWVFIGIVLALAMGAFSVPIALLFRPWRMKPLAYWLLSRLSRYRVWHIRWFLIRPTRKITVTMRNLASAAGRASAASERFAEAWQGAQEKR